MMNPEKQPMNQFSAAVDSLYQATTIKQWVSACDTLVKSWDELQEIQTPEISEEEFLNLIEA